MTFNTSNSIRIGLYNVKVNPHVSKPCTCFKCQTFVSGQCQMQRKNHLFQRSAMVVRFVKILTNVQIVAKPIWPSLKDFHIYIKEARKFVSMVSDSSAQKSYASVTKAYFTSVETQTDLIWLNKQTNQYH